MADDELVAFGAGVVCRKTYAGASVQGGGSYEIANAAVFENAW